MVNDGIHGMLPRHEMCAGAKKYWDFYNMTPGAGFYQREFGFYSLDKWKREEGLAEDADLDQLFGYDPQGRVDLGGLGWCEAGFDPIFETKVAVNVALNTWNDWMTPFLYINRTSDSTITAYLAVLTAALKQFGEKDYPKIFAISTVAIIPPFAIFLYFQKYIIQGIASAGLKG